MLTLASKLKRDEGGKTGRSPSGPSDSSHRVSIRDRLLIKEVAELEANLPSTCKLNFPDVNKLHSFQLAVSPGPVVSPAWRVWLGAGCSPPPHRSRPVGQSGTGHLKGALPCLAPPLWPSTHPVLDLEARVQMD